MRSAARDAPGVRPALARLGRRVRELRADRGLTQEDAAAIAGIDEKHWQAVETGRVNVTVATLVGIAKALDVELGSLFENT